jgi:glycosyltransferase involved in cell wall biosynthesis
VSHPRLSVILCTHNPDTHRLTRTLHGLMTQTLDWETWELIVVDNASAVALALPIGPEHRSKIRVVRESRLGLSQARATGVLGANGEVLVFVDDDNVLAPDYLEKTLAAFERLPRVGAIGGKSLPEFERPPHPWQEEFLPLLALRDLGPVEQFSLPPLDGRRVAEYPKCAPIGAGMAVRRVALNEWLAQSSDAIADRRGTDLGSGGDNDIVLSVLHAGWAVAYLPELKLKHLIPAKRLDPRYLGRLNRGIQRSWMMVLTRHGINPWPEIPRGTLWLRQFKSWFSHRAWRDPAARIRWEGSRGHFEGRRGRPKVLQHPAVVRKTEYTAP